MKKGISLILIVAHLAVVFHFTVPYLSYYANFTYFATEACINRGNPGMECNGSCKLDEMVHQEHQKDKDSNAAHHVDRAPNICFLLQYSYSFLHLLDNSAGQTYPMEGEAFDSLWQPEPVSPPPQTV